MQKQIYIFLTGELALAPNVADATTENIKMIVPRYLERDQAKAGFTGLVLSIAAMVSTTTAEVVQQALTTVTTQKVLSWCKQTLGASVQAKRRKAFAIPTETEQKRDQFRAVG